MLFLPATVNPLGVAPTHHVVRDSEPIRKVENWLSRAPYTSRRRCRAPSTEMDAVCESRVLNRASHHLGFCTPAALPNLSPTSIDHGRSFVMCCVLWSRSYCRCLGFDRKGPIEAPEHLAALNASHRWLQAHCWRLLGLIPPSSLMLSATRGAGMNVG